MRRIVVGARGQVTIPVELRKKLKIRSGARLHWSVENGRLVLTPIDCLLGEIRGLLKPAPGEASAFDKLFEERKRERKREKTQSLRHRPRL